MLDRLLAGAQNVPRCVITSIIHLQNEVRMAYQLVFEEAPTPGAAKGVGSVFLDNLPADYKVYLFYYGGAMPDEALESRLRQLGEMTGNNLFVNIGTLGDPRYGEITGRFEIKKYPVIILTAIDSLASPAAEYLTTYVRLDSRNMLDSPDRTIECVQELFNLFLQGKVSEAIAHAKWQERTELLAQVGHFFAGALKGLRDFVAGRDINIAFATFKLELKKSGG